MVFKTKEEAKANFEASIGYIPERYKAGVSKADWHTKAVSDAAEKNFADGVAKAIAAKSRQKGVAAVSNEEWKNAAVNKGASIIGERIRSALDKWSTNWGPMYDAVTGKVASLPARSTDWRANINNRLVPTVEAWRKAAGKT
jgi:autotransporter adhesin